MLAGRGASSRSLTQAANITAPPPLMSHDMFASEMMGLKQGLPDGLSGKTPPRHFIKARPPKTRRQPQPDEPEASVEAADYYAASDSKTSVLRDAPVASRWEPSDQIHVYGLDLPGRYIAHALAGSETIPPVHYLIHRSYVWKCWNEAGRRLTLHKGENSVAHSRVIGEYIGPRTHTVGSDEVIRNLLVTVPAGNVVRALEPIVHRLDRNSSICLVQEGLGIVEDVVSAYFPDELARPTFILGHMATFLDHPADNDERFSVSEVQQRRLYLTLVSSHGRGSVIKKHPPPERVVRQTHFLQLLTAMPGLNAAGYPMADFLRHKLPAVAFRAVADPIATLIGSTYDGILKNHFATRLMEDCITEVCDVIARLPECRDHKKFRGFRLRATMREQIFQALQRRKTGDSTMRAKAARGWETDVNYLTGFFVKRGRELQVPVSSLKTLMLAVRAKQAAAVDQQRADIPYQELCDQEPRK